MSDPVPVSTNSPLLPPPNALYAYVGAFVDELARSGVRHACVCPGSRSTPLAVAMARDPRIRIWMHLDERSAAFFALGLAKAGRQPVALVSTSGTAVANFMPAVVEARQAHLPLLVLTADRPPEARDAGAPQTIDQLRFYGAQVKWSVEMATPAATEELLRYARTIACRAVAAAEQAPAGPVHCNFPFREPLVPAAAPHEIPQNLSSTALHGRPDGLPYATVRGIDGAVQPNLAAASLARLATELARHPRGLIVCGPMDEPGLAEPLTRLARHLGYPILADPLSGLRRGPHDRTQIVDAYDAFLRDDRFARSLVPQIVLRFGAMPTAKPFLHYIQRYPDARQILVTQGGWPDPSLLASDVLTADPAAFCLALDAALDRRPSTGAQSDTTRWQQTWLEANRRTRAALQAEIATMQEPFEGRAFTELAALLPDGATLFAGNSMPVRDLDTFFPAGPRRTHLLANRGANGIDGVVSTALGVAALGGPTVLAIGDISLYHDMNGLLAAARHSLSLTVVLLNNDGGGIFSFLPQATTPLGGADDHATYETLFGTPHGLDFSHAAALYGAAYSRPDNWHAFRAAIQAGLDQGGLHIVELRTDRERNVTLHRRCWPAASAAIAPLLDAMEPA